MSYIANSAGTFMSLQISSQFIFKTKYFLYLYIFSFPFQADILHDLYDSLSGICLIIHFTDVEKCKFDFYMSFLFHRSAVATICSSMAGGMVGIILR